MSFQINNSNSKAYLFLTLAALFWSGNFIVGKAASFYEIPPFSLNFYRWLFAFLILFPFTFKEVLSNKDYICLLYTSPSPRDTMSSRMPSSA